MFLADMSNKYRGNAQQARLPFNNLHLIGVGGRKRITDFCGTILVLTRLSLANVTSRLVLASCSQRHFRGQD
jgi:hypothetical protein